MLKEIQIFRSLCFDNKYQRYSTNKNFHFYSFLEKLKM